MSETAEGAKVAVPPSGENIERQWWAVPLLAAFTAFFVATNFLWIALDQAPPDWDQAYYLGGAHRLYLTLINDGWQSLPFSFASTFDYKAPLIALLPLPLYLMFGPSDNVAVSVNIVLLVAANLLMYRLAWHLTRSKAVALLAVVLTATMPLIFGLSRLFFVEYALMTAVVAWLYALVRSEHLTRRGWTIGLGLLGGLGLLLKVLFPLYVAGPAVLIFWQRLKRRPRGAFKDGGKVLAIAFAVASIWYLPNLTSVLGFAYAFSVGPESRFYALGAVFSFPTVARYWLKVVNTVVSPYLLALLAFSLVPSRWIGRRADADGHDRLAVPFLWLWFLPAAAAVTFGVNKDVRYLAPALPAVAILTASLAVARCARAGIAPLAGVAMFAAVPMLSHVNTSFGWPGVQWQMGLLSLVSTQAAYASPPDSRRWPIDEIVMFIERFHRERSVKPANVVVMAEERNFNPSTLNYAASRLPSTVVRVHAASDYHRQNYAASLWRLEHAGYLVVRRDFSPSFLTWLFPQLLEVIDSGQIPLQRIRSFPLPDGTVAEVYQRL